VSFVVGSYLGLSEVPQFGPAMSRTDQSTLARTGISSVEAFTAAKNIELAQTLRELVKARRPIKSARPRVTVDTEAIDLGTVVQGSIVPARLKISNTGDAPLQFLLQPDCGCIRATPMGRLAPGESKVLEADFNSTDFAGPLRKRINVFTNDPSKPSIVVPVTTTVKPAYRFVRPEGSVLVTEGRQGTATVYLFFPEGSDVRPVSAQTSGLRSTVTQEEWTGELADPELGEGALPRKGYRYTIALNDAIPPGRAGTTLAVRTTHPQFPVIRYNLMVQRGIVSLPIRVHLGQVGKTAKTVPFLLTRPGKPFRILGIESGVPYLTAAHVATKGEEEYRIRVTYTGEAPPGDLETPLKIRTDDPLQPVVEVYVTGQVE
jgi:hypothetical protein